MAARAAGGMGSSNSFESSMEKAEEARMGGWEEEEEDDEEEEDKEDEESSVVCRGERRESSPSTECGASTVIAMFVIVSWFVNRFANWFCGSLGEFVTDLVEGLSFDGAREKKGRRREAEGEEGVEMWTMPAPLCWGLEIASLDSMLGGKERETEESQPIATKPRGPPQQQCRTVLASCDPHPCGIGSWLGNRHVFSFPTHFDIGKDSSLPNCYHHCASILLHVPSCLLSFFVCPLFPIQFVPFLIHSSLFLCLISLVFVWLFCIPLSFSLVRWFVRIPLSPLDPRPSIGLYLDDIQ